VPLTAWPLLMVGALAEIVLVQLGTHGRRAGAEVPPAVPGPERAGGRGR